MRRFTFKLSILAAACLVAATALAAAPTPAGNITKLSTAGGDALWVYGLDLSVSPCTNKDYAEVYTPRTAAERQLMNNMLVSAYLSGKKVRLTLSTLGCGATQRPAYSLVELQ